MTRRSNGSCANTHCLINNGVFKPDEARKPAPNDQGHVHVVNCLLDEEATSYVLRHRGGMSVEAWQAGEHPLTGVRPPKRTKVPVVPDRSHESMHRPGPDRRAPGQIGGRY